MVWIATQIVEASLDIDFDLLFTELSDLNGLFQRMGRCYRNRDLGDLPHNCFVFTRKCSGVGIFIDREIHRLSKEALSEVDGMVTEKQKMFMIEKLYTKEKLLITIGTKRVIDYVDRHSLGNQQKEGKKYFNIDNKHNTTEVYKNKEEKIEEISRISGDYKWENSVRSQRARAREKHEFNGKYPRYLFEHRILSYV